MTLSDKEYTEFLKLHLDLLFYVGQQMKVISARTTFADFVKMDFIKKSECRNMLLENDQLLDSYLALSIDTLTKEQVAIVEGFKRRISGDFVIFRCLAKNAIFIELNSNKFYAVKALRDRFDQFFDQFPTLIKTTLLPYNGQIIYDGFINRTGIYIGRNMASTMNEDYREAKKNKQIVTTM